MSWKLDYSPTYFTSNSYNASGIYAMIILQTSILFRINEQQVKALSKKRISMHFHFIRNKRQLNQNFRIFEFLNVWIFTFEILNYEIFELWNRAQAVINSFGHHSTTPPPAPGNPAKRVLLDSRCSFFIWIVCLTNIKLYWVFLKFDFKIFRFRLQKLLV